MRILIVDDHVLFREGLKSLLGGLADVVTIHEAGSVETGLALGLQHDEFSLILLDLNLPGSNGFDGLQALQQRFPTSPVVVLSGRDDGAVVAAALTHGAQGFIPKSVSAESMLDGLRRVLAGESCFPAPGPLGASPRIEGALLSGKKGLI